MAGDNEIEIAPLPGGQRAFVYDTCRHPALLGGVGGGKTHTTTVGLVVARDKGVSSLSISVSPTALKAGQSVSVTQYIQHQLDFFQNEFDLFNEGVQAH